MAFHSYRLSLLVVDCARGDELFKDIPDPGEAWCQVEQVMPLRAPLKKEKLSSTLRGAS
jgi:hypothetical protein